MINNKDLTLSYAVPIVQICFPKKRFAPTPPSGPFIKWTPKNDQPPYIILGRADFQWKCQIFSGIRVSPGRTNRRMVTSSLFRFLFPNTWHALKFRRGKNTKEFHNIFPSFCYWTFYKGYNSVHGDASIG